MKVIKDEILEKKRRLNRYMEDKGIEAILLAKKSNFFWASCGARSKIVEHSDAGFSYLLYHKDKFYLLTTNIEAQRMLDEEIDLLIDPVLLSYKWFEEDGLKKAIEKIIDIKKVYQDSMLVKGAKNLAPDFDKIRYKLTDSEKKRYLKLCSDTSICMTRTCMEIKKGFTELEVQARLSERLISENIMPYVLLVGSDKRLMDYRHPIPTSKKIEKYVMVVICGQRDGLISACTRFVHFKEPSKEIEEAKKIISYIDAMMILGSRPGRRYSDILKDEKKAFDSYGLKDEWENHHQGGPLGYEGRYFLVTPDTDHKIDKDHAIAWNPSMRGYKSEDTLIVGPEENIVATRDKDWPAITVETEYGQIERPDILIK